MKNSHDAAAIRIIDANLNRSREGLRVCEDVTRFILNDKTLSASIKAARHNIDKIVRSQKIDYRILLHNRDTASDVSRDFSILERKKNWQAVFIANMQRAKESLRVLEEFSKLFDEYASISFKAIRFKVYNIEKESLKRHKALSAGRHCRVMPSLI